MELRQLLRIELRDINGQNLSSPSVAADVCVARRNCRHACPPTRRARRGVLYLCRLRPCRIATTLSCNGGLAVSAYHWAFCFCICKEKGELGTRHEEKNYKEKGENQWHKKEIGAVSATARSSKSGICPGLVASRFNPWQTSSRWRAGRLSVRYMGRCREM